MANYKEKYEIGDRYEWENGNIWEVIDSQKAKSIVGVGVKTGTIIYIPTPHYFKTHNYLGNFSKSNNFQQIYDILNAD